jgi:preprotein translocase subunit SecA
MTIEFRFQEPAPQMPTLGPPPETPGLPAGPPPASTFTEIHLDPLTGENERAPLTLAGDLGALTLAQRGAAPSSALPDGWQRTGRNAVCPCGSGKKFKHCHGVFV